MKPAALAGLVIALIGAVILFRGLSYKSDEAVLRVGDLKASVEARRRIPTWVGAVALVGGVVLLVNGTRRRG
ncbi:MAG TPA: hypothetical protein VGQ69_11875 [Gemmatimonadales bacterium]|jgi:hypothetical protein|nr:hypothetical protein [Gemmatimonadales bacterium]